MGAFQYPWDDAAPSDRPRPPAAETRPAQPRPRGRPRTPAIGQAATAGAVLPAEGAVLDWRYHHLTINGPAETVARFAAAARGSGVIPWQLDFAALEEDIFLRAATQPAHRRRLTIEGCRILARQFRDRVAAHQARATEHAREGAARVGHSFVCAFDLHVLLPVPAAILQLGPTHPRALAWLGRHWGVTDRLRQVAVRDKVTIGRRLPRGHTVIGYGFFAYGETPRAAVAQLAAQWSALRFALTPRPLT